MSRRGSWGRSSEITFDRRDSHRGRAGHSSEHDDAGSPCARGDWCSGATIRAGAGGTRERLAARTPRVFCGACETRITACLGELPGAYLRLAFEIGRKGGTPGGARSPAGPRLPLREDVDAIMRLTARLLRGWEARTRAVPPAWTPPVQVPVDSIESVAAAASALRNRLGVMLALQPGWMTRSFALHPGRRGDQLAALSRELEELEATHGDQEIVRVGVDFISLQVQLSGRDAGEEILHLHYRARTVLGDTKAQPEAFDGVPCPRCGDIALDRAEPPSDPAAPAMWSHCASCGSDMDTATFHQWVDWYATRAETAGLPACRRCQAGRCPECAWAACACRASGHTAA